jgi:hypothetical protein
MPEEVKPDPKQAPTQDAQLAAEEMNSGKEEVPTVDLEGDYEASKQFSVSDVDRTSSGAKAAEAATAPELKVSEPEETKVEAAATGNPNDYREMASNVGSTTEAGTNVSDDLVQKALEKGQPGQ